MWLCGSGRVPITNNLVHVSGLDLVRVGVRGI